MRAEIKGFSSPDIDLGSYRPDDPDTFFFLLEVYIGPKEEGGAEQLQIEVGTPAGFAKFYKDQGCV